MSMCRSNILTTSSINNKRKPFPGMKGDPRMNRAVAARLKDPGRLLDALRAGGFTYPEDCTDGLAVDSDNVQLVQRKNQLNRRLRLHRWQQKQQQKQQPQQQQQQQQRQRTPQQPGKHYDGVGSFAGLLGSMAFNKKRPLTPSPTAIDFAKRRKVSPDFDPFSSSLSEIRSHPCHNRPSSPSPGIIKVLPTTIPLPAVQIISLQQQRPPTPRPPSPIPLAAIYLNRQQTRGTAVEPGDGSVTYAANGNNAASPEAEDGVASLFCQEDEEERAKRFLLKTFAIDIDSDPFFTEEEKQEEERELPPEERAAILTDLHGKCPTGCATATNSIDWNSLIGKFLAIKTVMQVNLPVLVPLSVQSLLQEMRYHVSVLQRNGACLPDVDTAISWDLLQSQSINHRLELFLRREEMDAKLGAIRFVQYWTKRYELFGRDNFCLPMTLTGAMRDDILALETGTFRLLPQSDSSGRRILFYAHCFNTKEGYASKSMFRVCWYMLESLLEDPVTAQNGFVVVSWKRDESLWNYDRDCDRNFATIEEECIPIRAAAVHICDCNNLVIDLIKPIVLGMVERRVRHRMWWHKESGEELFDELGGCCITQDMVPIEMGGTSQSSHLSWLRGRLLAAQ